MLQRYRPKNYLKNANFKSNGMFGLRRKEERIG